MPCSSVITVELVWDLTLERLTLGGGLVLRQEGELLCQLNNATSVDLHLICDELEYPAAERLSKLVFGASGCLFRLVRSAAASPNCWPPVSQRESPEFSYFGFSRLSALYKQHGLVPRLRWSAHYTELARLVRSRFLGRLICIHLRSVAPFSAEESNADGATWDAFFALHARPGAIDFILLGQDPLPTGLILRPGLNRAAEMGLDLATQMSLVSEADGFLGMASGLCTAANLSATPHVIFKHPAHHAKEMVRELGDHESFPFALPRQQLWRCVVDDRVLSDALSLILS
jgi:hypothetical protein